MAVRTLVMPLKGSTSLVSLRFIEESVLSRLSIQRTDAIRRLVVYVVIRPPVFQWYISPITSIKATHESVPFKHSVVRLHRAVCEYYYNTKYNCLCSVGEIG